MNLDALHPVFKQMAHLGYTVTAFEESGMSPLDWLVRVHQYAKEVGGMCRLDPQDCASDERKMARERAIQRIILLVAEKLRGSANELISNPTSAASITEYALLLLQCEGYSKSALRMKARQRFTAFEAAPGEKLEQITARLCQIILAMQLFGARAAGSDVKECVHGVLKVRRANEALAIFDTMDDKEFEQPTWRAKLLEAMAIDQRRRDAEIADLIAFMKIAMDGKMVASSGNMPSRANTRPKIDFERIAAAMKKPVGKIRELYRDRKCFRCEGTRESKVGNCLSGYHQPAPGVNESR
ncbi:hypothetical protein HK105_206234 [Polyrhizophydium stewartii]|uniref:Uncharacterized protein n=1 Tax=Polyrhizophydium stewartii TaxID=2732419 RepID=A0ABR4N433_9FUNG|nr:hypothetical protein HK105_000247 [Polyrhizophydium stewartii]